MRRIEAGLNPGAGSVASLFVSRLESAVMAKVPPRFGDFEEVWAQFAKAGIDVGALAAQLQEEGAKSFVKSWDELMGVIISKCSALKKAGAS